MQHFSVGQRLLVRRHGNALNRKTEAVIVRVTRGARYTTTQVATDKKDNQVICWMIWDTITCGRFKPVHYVCRYDSGDEELVQQNWLSSLPKPIVAQAVEEDSEAAESVNLEQVVQGVRAPAVGCPGGEGSTTHNGETPAASGGVVVVPEVVELRTAECVPD